MDESIKEYEYYEYGPESGAIELNKTGHIRFKIENQDTFLNISKSYLQFKGQINRVKNGVKSDFEKKDKIAFINNALMYLFSSIKYSLGGNEIEYLAYPGQMTSMIGYLKYSEDFEKTNGMNQLWYRDGINSINGFKMRHNYVM